MSRTRHKTKGPGYEYWKPPRDGFGKSVGGGPLSSPRAKKPRRAANKSNKSLTARGARRVTKQRIRKSEGDE